jgi:hypothetical protein
MVGVTGSIPVAPTRLRSLSYAWRAAKKQIFIYGALARYFGKFSINHVASSDAQWAVVRFIRLLITIA